MIAGSAGSGLADVVHDSQAIYRTVLRALSRPGEVLDLPGAPEPPAPLLGATAAFALALLDRETAVWLDNSLATQAVRCYLADYCGIAEAAAPDQADFALIGAAASMP